MAEEITEYVVGFAFDFLDRVALIRKNRPKWQKNKWNGIGGHVEPGEDPWAAMVREFHEETGLTIETWDEFAVMEFPGARITFFKARVEVLDVRTMTDEEVRTWWMDTLPSNVIPNLKWLVPLAAYTADEYEILHIKAAAVEALA